MTPLRQRGQSSVEFVVIFPVLVLLVFGIIQTAMLYQGRATLNYATLLAARAGALHNGNVGEMRNAIARGLAPLFAAEASPDGYAMALAKANAEAAGPANLVAVEILNPTSASFQDFGRTRLDAGNGRELPNDTLAYRSSNAGSASHQSVQDANLLHVRVTYCFRLLVPVIDRLLQAAFNDTSVSTNTSGFGMRNPFGIGEPPAGVVCNNPAFDGRRIYIQSEAIVRMQTPFFEENLAGSTTPGTPGTSTPPDTDTPPDPTPPPDPDPPTPPDPGTPPCM